MFALAILFFVLFGPSERVALEYFYDESEQKLFTAPAGSIPPIKGINDDQLDGVRAIVIAPKGKRGDESAHRIAYLEKWSPQLKQHLEAAAGPRPPAKPCPISSIVPKENFTSSSVEQILRSGTP